jgi:phosphatidylserine decarboxylase
LHISIHREGWPFIGLAVAANAVLFAFSLWAGAVFLLFTAWCIAFFRDPERHTPAEPGLIICPADGRLLPLATLAPPPELGMGNIAMTRLSIFMDVFNVHVNRVPCSGTALKTAYRPGRFFNASFDKASEHNERMAILIRREEPGAAPVELAVVQIAGLIARRIKCDLHDRQQVRRGDRFGIIRFGSRVDIYLPQGTNVVVQAGQKMRAGETILARL